MTIKDQLSAEQWKALLNAPSAAAIYVSTASGGGLEMIKEILTASSFLQELLKKEGGSGYGPLVDDLLATIKGMSPDEVKANAIQFESRDPATGRLEIRKVVADGVAAVAALPGAGGFKQWPMDLARAVAATRTGGLPGIGASSVIDDEEQAALDELQALMGALSGEARARPGTQHQT